MGMGGNNSVTIRLGKSIPKASSTPNTPPEAPIVGYGMAMRRERNDRQLDECSRQDGGDIHAQVASGSEDAFGVAAKHVEREHVEQQMHQVGVQEARTEQLPRLELGDRVQMREHPSAPNRPEREANNHRVAEDALEAEGDDVDEDQCSRDGRHDASRFTRARSGMPGDSSYRLVHER